MEQRPLIMNASNMIGTTERAKSRVLSWIKLANDVEIDAKHDERIAANECKACFYTSWIGGAAITSRPCMCCGKVVMYGSTSTDVLCPECSKAHGLCKHCGGDLEMNSSREWPIAATAHVE